MTATVAQRHGGSLKRDPAGRASSATWPYLIEGATSDIDAKDALIAAAPTTYDGLPVKDYEVEPTENANFWYGSVSYGLSLGGGVSGEAENYVEEFDISGQNLTVMQSLETVEEEGEAIDFGGAVGVTQGGVNGVDIIVPAYTFGVTRGWPAEKIDDSYRQMLADLTGKVNDSAFGAYEAGEVLFLGARGSRTSADASADWSITYRFAVSRNRSDFPIKYFAAGSMTSATVNKNGWEYVWVYCAPRVVSGILVTVPVKVSVEKVYEEESFSGIADVLPS